MRYVPISELKEGMVLAQPFYGNKFDVLLAPGVTVVPAHIPRINQLGYPGVYIVDDISQDVVAEPVLPENLRLATIKNARDMMDFAEQPPAQRTRSNVKITKERQEKIIMPLISFIISHSRRVIDVIDLKPYEGYKYYHTANVVALSLLLGLEVGITGNQLYELGMSALLYDIGNAFVPPAILGKPDKLSDEERELVKSHCQMGFDFLRESFDLTIEACMGALQHHENFDGTGYPTGLKKNKISIYGRIIAITDVYDALTSRRPFRQPMSPAEAMSYISQKSGKLFDPEIVETLRQLVSLYPAGSIVELSSGVRGIVVENLPRFPARPKVLILDDKMAKTSMAIDLHKDPEFKNVNVTRIVEM